MLRVRKSETVRKDNTFWDHLEELRERLIFSLIVVVLLSVACYLKSDQILNHLTKPLALLSQKTYFLSPYDAFVVKLQVSFWGAVLLSMPVFLTELWLFVAPGLYQREKAVFLNLIFASVFLFLLGLALAFFAVIPATVRFFLGFSTAELVPMISIGQYLNFAIGMALAFGLAFETPVLLIGFVKFGLLKADQLSAARAYTVVVIFVFAAIVTPSPDPFSQCALAIPLWILFEISLLIARAINWKK